MKRALLSLSLASVPVAALAAPSPFGIATPDGGGTVAFGGPFRGFFIWVASEQSAFYRALTGALSALSSSPHAAAILIGLSLAYGVFHAVGPGHGKAVIASYLLATGDTLKRGIAISFASALVQALTAIVVVSIGTIVLKVTAMTMTRATDALEIASYAMIALCGVWLLWSKTVGRHGHGTAAPASGEGASHVHDASCRIHGHGTFAMNDGRLGLAPARLAYGGGFAATAPVADFSCDCGHAHVADPATLTRPLTLRSAYAAILAVGIRPCSGAVIVLVFALSQQLYWAGILSVLAMAAGTGITVAALATLAVKARDFALRFSGGERPSLAGWLLRGVEIAAAAGILLFGVAMLGGALVTA